MVGQFKKAYLHRPIKILHFLIPARIQKCLTLTPIQFLEKFMEILEWSTLQEQIQCCSILEEQKHRSLRQEPVSDTCKQHWQWGKGDWFQNLCEVLQLMFWKQHHKGENYSGIDLSVKIKETAKCLREMAYWLSVTSLVIFLSFENFSLILKLAA